MRHMYPLQVDGVELRDVAQELPVDLLRAVTLAAASIFLWNSTFYPLELLLPHRRRGCVALSARSRRGGVTRVFTTCPSRQRRGDSAPSARRPRSRLQSSSISMAPTLSDPSYRRRVHQHVHVCMRMHMRMCAGGLAI